MAERRGSKDGRRSGFGVLNVLRNCWARICTRRVAPEEPHERDRSLSIERESTCVVPSPFDPGFRTIHSWLLFDFLIIAVSILDVWIFNLMMEASFSGQAMSLLRVLRILRVLRSVKLVRYVKDLYLLMNGFLQAFRTLGWVIFLLCLFNYVMALFAMRLIAVEDLTYFGDLGTSMYSLFIVLTLEKWPEIAETTQGGSWAFFVFYILVSHFMILNLFVAVIVENVTRASTTADVQFLKELQNKRSAMMAQLYDLFKSADTDENGSLTTEEFSKAVDCGSGAAALRALDVKRHEIDWLFEVLDIDGDHELSLDEFMEGMLAVKSSEISRNMFQLQYAVLKELKKLQGSMAARDPDSVHSTSMRKDGAARDNASSVMWNGVKSSAGVLDIKSSKENNKDGEDKSVAEAMLEEASQWCMTIETMLDGLRSETRQVQSIARGGRVETIVEAKDELEPRAQAVALALGECREAADAALLASVVPLSRAAVDVPVEGRVVTRDPFSSVSGDLDGEVLSPPRPPPTVPGSLPTPPSAPSPTLPM